jgi:hypothetical protein
MSGPLRMMFRLGRSAPAVLRILFRLNLRAVRRGGARASERMAAWAPEPDRILLQRADVSGGFMACFEEACRQGPAGHAEDLSLIARPWGFELGAVKVPVLCGTASSIATCRWLRAAISPVHFRIAARRSIRKMRIYRFH